MFYFKGKDKRKTPILHINNINEDLIDLDMLQLFMAHRRHSNGGEMADWKVNSSQSPGSTTVQITYKEQGSKSYTSVHFGTYSIRVMVGCVVNISVAEINKL